MSIVRVSPVMLVASASFGAGTTAMVAVILCASVVILLLVARHALFRKRARMSATKPEGTSG